jgi:uncharacterized protein YndB with AHSA1/START domain/RimJ/RimL family protein N-acetyltransferase
MRTLIASRCTLEPLRTAHAPEMFTVLSDPAIYEFENAPPSSREWLARRYERLEQRESPDGTQRWLNWVVRLPAGQLAGYVQATVLRSATSYVAYELCSRYWRQGIGRDAVAAMLGELSSQYRVHTFVALLKAANFRSAALLCSLEFRTPCRRTALAYGAEEDEVAMVRSTSRNVRATRIARRIDAPRAVVYRALIDPSAVARWKCPEGMRCEVHSLDARESGSLRISLTYDALTRAGKTSSRTDTYHGRLVTLLVDRQVVEVDEFETDDPALHGEMTLTITLADNGNGTDLVALHEGIPPGVALDDNETGWRLALARLAALVESGG